MVNPRQKGYRTQYKLIKELEAQGFEVGVVERTGRFIKVKDMFGLFDLVAIHPTKGIHLIQVTTNRPHTHKKFQEFSKKYPEPKVAYRQCVWESYKGWKEYVYIEGKKKEVLR